MTIKLRIESTTEEQRATLIEFAKQPKYQATKFRLFGKQLCVFTCEVPNDQVTVLLTDLRYEFAKEYYQGWTVPPKKT